MNQHARFRRVVVPTEQVIETKDGQKVQTEKRVLPGLRAREHGPRRRRLDGREEHARRDGVRRRRHKPVPLSQAEVDRILRTGAADAASARARRSSSRSASRWKVTLRPALRLRRRDRRRQRRRSRS